MNRLYGLIFTNILALALMTSCGFTRFGAKSSDSKESVDKEVESENSTVVNEDGTITNGTITAEGNEQVPAPEGKPDDKMVEEVPTAPNPTLSEMELEKVGIGIKSAQQIFETMVAATGIPADNPQIQAGYESFIGALTPEERSRSLRLSPGQVTAMTNLMLPFCQTAATDQAVRDNIYGTRVNFNQAPNALSATERTDLGLVWAEKIWSDGRLGTIPPDQLSVLNNFINQVITDVQNPGNAASLPLVATTVCVGTVIAFQAIEF